MIRTTSLVTLAVSLAACVSGSPTSSESAGTITGVVRYAGPEHGTLRVAVFASFPPRGAPVAEISIDTPTFPQRYEVIGVPPGRYFVLAVVDTNPADGDRYRPRVDPGGTFGRYDSPASVVLDTSAPASAVDISLVPPTAASPWDR
jgi:hypothetical protein